MNDITEEGKILYDGRIETSLKFCVLEITKETATARNCDVIVFWYILIYACLCLHTRVLPIQC
jgi:hypothetical protein